MIVERSQDRQIHRCLIPTFPIVSDSPGTAMSPTHLSGSAAFRLTWGRFRGSPAAKAQESTNRAQLPESRKLGRLIQSWASASDMRCFGEAELSLTWEPWADTRA